MNKSDQSKTNFKTFGEPGPDKSGSFSTRIMEGDSVGQEGSGAEKAIFGRSGLLARTPPTKNNGADDCPTASASGTMNQNEPAPAVGQVKSVFALMMKKAGVHREAQSADEADVEELDGGRSMKRKEKSPIAERVEAKRTKSAFTIDNLEAAIATLSAQVGAQSTIKREIRAQMREVCNVFAAFKEEFITMASEVAKARETKEEGVTHDFRAGLSSNMTEREIEEYADKQWPPAAFRATELKAASEGDKIVSMMVFPESFKKDQNFVNLANQIPALKNATEELLRSEKMLRIQRQEEISITGIRTEALSKMHIVMAANLGKEPDFEIMDFVNWSAALKAASKESAINVVELQLPKSTNVMRARKILECCFFGTDIKVHIKLSRGQRTGPKDGLDRVKGLVIKTGDRSFSEVVKELKKNVQPDALGVIVRSVKSTRGGDIHLQYIETKIGAKEAFSKSITNVDCIQEINHLQKWKGVVITEIEEGAEKDDVSDILIKELGLSPSDLRLNDFRPSRFGTKMVTAYLPVKAATDLIGIGRIRIGWTFCRVKEKIDPDFCSRCQRFGHTAKACKESTPAKKMCMRCGSVDHVGSSCNEPEFCFTCQEKGHRANSMRCNQYRKMVDEKRLRNGRQS